MVFVGERLEVPRQFVDAGEVILCPAAGLGGENGPFGNDGDKGGQSCCVAGLQLLYRHRLIKNGLE